MLCRDSCANIAVLEELFPPSPCPIPQTGSKSSPSQRTLGGPSEKMGNFLNRRNRCSKRRLAGLNIGHEMMIQVSWGKGREIRAIHMEAKCSQPAGICQRSSLFKGMKRLGNFKSPTTKEEKLFYFVFILLSVLVKTNKKGFSMKKKVFWWFFQDLYGIGPCFFVFSLPYESRLFFTGI